MMGPGKCGSVDEKILLLNRQTTVEIQMYTKAQWEYNVNRTKETKEEAVSPINDTITRFNVIKRYKKQVLGFLCISEFFLIFSPNRSVISYVNGSDMYINYNFKKKLFLLIN